MTSTPILNNRAIACLVLLALADLLLTGWLLDVGSNDLREGNPLAAWCLRRCGWVGLVALKVAVVGLACGLLAVVARSRPRTARRMLTLCCVVQAAAVLYCAALVVVLPWLRSERERAEQVLVERGQRLDAEHARINGYLVLRRQLSQEVIKGGLSLAEAVKRFKEHELVRHPHRRDLLAARYPGKSLPWCLETQLIDQIEIDLGVSAPPRQELLTRLRAGLSPVASLRPTTPLSLFFLKGRIVPFLCAVIVNSSYLPSGSGRATSGPGREKDPGSRPPGSDRMK